LYGTVDDLPADLAQQLARRLSAEPNAAVVALNPSPGAAALRLAVAPIPAGRPCAEALAVVVRTADGSLDALLAALEVAALAVRQWRLEQRRKGLEAENRALAAIAELSDQMTRCATLQHACAIAVQQLQEYLGCRRVLLGLSRSPNRPCRLVADSQHPQRRAPREQDPTIGAALDEVVLRDRLTVWPPTGDGERHALRTLKRLGEAAGDAGIVAAPLRDETGRLCGAWIFLGDRAFAQCERTRNFLRAAGGRVATTLDLQKRWQSVNWLAWMPRFIAWTQRWPGRCGVIGCLLLLALMACPATYRLKCDCELQPVTRRFVAAPFDGKLERSLVEPGDLVQAGQVLAQMDGREIRWELAGAAAELARAQKQRDGYLAGGEYGPAELTRFEIERLQLKTQLLENRHSNLEIRSPLDGIVIRGDLKKAEGAPVQVGQTLFEVAPLDKMIVEIAISDEDIAYARVGADVEVALDAFPAERWPGKLARIHPRSEVQDEQNVFLGEFTLGASELPLRPGMRGEARIVGPRRSWGWILLHRPWDKLTLWWGW
jgi:biotin carboxyl carrier protein